MFSFHPPPHFQERSPNVQALVMHFNYQSGVFSTYLVTGCSPKQRCMLCFLGIHTYYQIIEFCIALSYFKRPLTSRTSIWSMGFSLQWVRVAPLFSSDNFRFSCYFSPETLLGSPFGYPEKHSRTYSEWIYGLKQFVFTLIDDNSHFA